MSEPAWMVDAMRWLAVAARMNHFASVDGVATLEGARTYAAPLARRLAALEAFAKAFAGAEWDYEGMCSECDGEDPAEITRRIEAAVERDDEDTLRSIREDAQPGHRDGCPRGAAVAALKASGDA